jgi:hypothetical protein
MAIRSSLFSAVHSESSVAARCFIAMSDLGGVEVTRGIDTALSAPPI